MANHKETAKQCTILCSAMNIYLGLSVGLNVYNKYILNLNKFPLFLLTCQFFFLFCSSGILIFTLLRPKLETTGYWVTSISSFTYLRKLLPIGLLYGSDIIFTNIAIANGPLAFVQMVKSGVPIIVLFYKIFERNPSSALLMTPSIIISMLLLTCGQLLIHLNEVDFNWICFITSIAALFASGTKIYVIEKLLKSKKINIAKYPNNKPYLDNNDINNNNEHTLSNMINNNEGDNDQDDERSAFIGYIDSFSPARLMLTDTDNEDDNYNDVDTNNKYRENVELQIVKTNKKETVKLIRKTPIKNGLLTNPKNSDPKKDLNFFRSVLDKLSLDNIDSESDNSDMDHLLNIKKEKQKVFELTEDIPLNESQKYRQETSKFVWNNMNNLNNKSQQVSKQVSKQKMHSMLALFYFAPISWMTATICFILFEYKSIRNNNVFNSSELLISLLFQYFLSGIIAFALNWCELFMIGRWNALSFCIFGVIKLILVLGASWILFDHSFTFYSLSGYGLCICGVCFYNYSQIKNKKKVKKNIKQIIKILHKSIKNIKCIKSNKRFLYNKIWNEFPQDDLDHTDDYDDSSSEEPIYN